MNWQIRFCIWSFIKQLNIQELYRLKSNFLDNIKS